jgi:hypothetical protein
VSLRIATAGLDLLADALAGQGAQVAPVDWRPPAGGEPEDVALLTAVYGDERVERANAEALARLQSARPMLTRAGLARDLLPDLGGRTVLHAGPPVEWGAMCAPQRLAVCAAAMFEGWAVDLEDAHRMGARGEITLAPAHSLEAAGAMTGVISPSMGCWEARDEEHGGTAVTPMNDGPGDAFWLGVASAESIRRQRVLAERVTPGFAAALRSRGPLDVFGLNAQGLEMGDDCHMRHQATTMLLLRATLPAIAERAPHAVHPIASMLADNGHFALTVSIAAARAALAGTRGIRGSSLIVFISRNGVEAAVQIAGLPDRWFLAPSPLVGDALYRPGFGEEDAAPDIGDSALVECCGLGGAASAASPSVAAFLGGDMGDAVERTRQMGDICIGRSERFRLPLLGGEGTPLGVDARACLDLRATPLINTGILHRRDGGQIGAGVAQVPLAPFREALVALRDDLAAWRG